MNAIILAAGYGKRLGKITETTPKCLIKVYNEPILIRWIKCLKNSGVKKILVNTHYKNEKVSKVINKIKNIEIIISYEKKLLGTAGTLIKNLDFFDTKDGIILSADNFYKKKDLINFIKFHKTNRKMISLFTFNTTDTKNTGIFKLNENGTIKSFHEKINLNSNSKINHANGSILLFKKYFLKSLRKKNYKDISKDLIPNNLKNISIFKSKFKIIDIGIIKNYNYLIKKNIINE